MSDKAIRNSEEYILSEESSFQVQEAYKNLRTNVQFSLPAGECHVIGVTSSERNEGKSTTTTNLAISFAQLGKKVLIIDGDLRLPTIAKKLKIKALPGLSNYLVGECELKEACKIDTKNNMYVIPSGNIPPEATWLLQSEKMQHLIDTFKKKVDYIFIDLPPVTIVPDAKVIADMVDGYIVVVHKGATRRKKVDEMMASLQMTSAKVIGFVTTRSDKNSSRSYKKGYYKSDYGYGYATKVKKK